MLLLCRKFPFPNSDFLFILAQMIIKSLSVSDFRNHSSTTLALSPGVNILVGDNAQGKTNLLEAVYLTCVGKGWRTNKDREMIKFDADTALVRTCIRKSFGDCTVEISLSRTAKKSIKINSIPIQRMGELMGQVNCVFFSPDELRLIKEAPVDRRRFLDIDISQIDKTYFYALLRYNKILLQRNALLKNSKENIVAGLEIWDRQLANIGAQIIARRLVFIEQLRREVAKVHNYLTEGCEKIELCYINITTGESESSDFDTAKVQPSDVSLLPSERIEQILIEQLFSAREKDMRLRTTTIGPHRDDVKILVNDRDVRHFASQGQQRTVALSLKLAELEIFRAATGEMPILLLDDVLSELDVKRQSRLVRALKKCQSIITSTTLPQLPEKESSVFKIQSGMVEL